MRVLPRRRSREEASGARYPRWYWPGFALPGTLWMLVLFVLPFYVVVSIAFGTVDPAEVKLGDPIDLSKRLDGTPELRFPTAVSTKDSTV